MNVTDPIREVARTRPDAVAMIEDNDIALSYGALVRHIDRFAHRVQALGLLSGQIVGLTITGPDEALAVILALGLAHLGIASSETDLPARHLAAVFVQPGVTPPPNVPAYVFDRSWFAEPTAHGCGTEFSPTAVHQDGETIFRIFATSGTTGLSRRCAVSHSLQVTRITGKAYPVISPDWPTITICAMGLGSTRATRFWLSTLHTGGTIVFTNPRRLLNTVLRHGVTSIALSPATLQEIVARIPPGLGPLPPLRAITVGGSQLPARLAQTAAERLCANIVTALGTTEAGTVCRGRYDKLTGIPLGVGEILPWVEVQAVDASNMPLPPGTEGLLRIRSPDAVAGYFDDEDATQDAFRDGWFYPGDIGSVTPEGVLIVTGRTGDFINHGGVKVNPRLIEDVLMSLPRVNQAVAFGVPDADGLAQIWAAIVPEAPIEAAVLNRLCAEKLGAKAPKFILQMKDLPRNENGKVVTSVLVDYAAARYRSAGKPG
jgi:acyl-CoA synthetase (AMP-forming)/AMP-acid ligase II